MCGIAGLLQFTLSDRASLAELSGMQSALAHRGPDGQGRWASGAVGLAHTRLALVGLDSGAQPLSSEDGQIQLVLNGEIYNHRELRAGLERRGHRFATDSDSEVVVHLYEEQGERCLDALNGPFALALWDQRQRRLLLARDRFGMRPLYWTERRAGWAFASEIKALLTLRDVPRALDMTALCQTVQFWAPVAPRSAFAGIACLAPGSWLLLQPRHPAQPQPMALQQRWWDIHWTPDPHPGTFEEAAHRVRERLRAATEQQLQADVPVGVYLSGGLDSTALAALAAQAAHRHGSPLQAFALGFDDPAYDETPQQDAVAQALGLTLQRIRVGRGDIGQGFERLVWHAETPLVRSAAAPLMHLARLARQGGVKAVLSGEGADEVFAGYDLFKELRIRRLMAGGTASWRSAPLRRLYPYLRQSPVGLGGLSARWWSTSTPDADDPLLPLRTRMQVGNRFAALLHPHWRERWETEHVPAAHAGLTDSLPADFTRWPWLARARHLEFKGLLAGYLLSSQGDRVAMAEGLELRHPYLDHALVDDVARLPSAWSLRGLNDKRLLREALRPLLPAPLRQRAKQPYRAPDVSGLLGPDGQLPPALEDLVSADALHGHPWLDAAAATRLLTKCRQGRAVSTSDQQAFVTLLSLLSWQRQFDVKAVGERP